jgi:tetratricopeptide (TPR) repeat protein
MKNYVLILVILLACPLVNSAEYGHYDLKRILPVSETTAEKKYTIDSVYLDQILDDLVEHAFNYPPRFDTPEAQQRATQDVGTLSKIFDILLAQPKPNIAILIRAGFLNSIGHNLDIVGAAQKTILIFEKLLAIAPDHPRGNYLYGHFLGGIGKSKEALHYLQKALTLGVDDAAYSLGITYLILGDKDNALKNLQDYKQRRPGDTNVDPLIEGIRNGKFVIKNK